MKSLNEFNTERRKLHDDLAEVQRPHPNGIECPECGAELWDSDPMMILTSNPPQMDIHCEGCQYRGYRLV